MGGGDHESVSTRESLGLNRDSDGVNRNRNKRLYSAIQQLCLPEKLVNSNTIVIIERHTAVLIFRTDRIVKLHISLVQTAIVEYLANIVLCNSY